MRGAEHISQNLIAVVSEGSDRLGSQTIILLERSLSVAVKGGKVMITMGALPCRRVCVCLGQGVAWRPRRPALARSAAAPRQSLR